MPFQIIRNDITKVKADAIVNTANPDVVVGRGTDYAVYHAAGRDRLLAERKKIGIMHPGQAAHTPAFNLDAKYIIHTVGPAWIDGNHDEREILHSCYEKSLNLATELSCRSIAFPLIATGSYGFPKDEALQIALAEIDRFLLSHEMEVILVVLGRKAFELSEKLVGDIEEYIDEHGIAELHEAEYGIWYGSERWERPEQNKTSAMLGAPLFPDVSGMSLDEVLERSEDTFQQKLFKLIEESGMDDVTVYKKANIDRKVFSRIRCKKDYKPTKKQRWLLQSRFSWICRRCWICCPGQGLHSLPAASLT